MSPEVGRYPVDLPYLEVIFCYWDNQLHIEAVGQKIGIAGDLSRCPIHPNSGHGAYRSYQDNPHYLSQDRRVTP